MPQLQTRSEYRPENLLQPCLPNGCLFVVLAVSCGVYGQGLSEEEKEEILNAHNHYRGMVDPIATNMLKMVRLV